MKIEIDDVGTGHGLYCIGMGILTEDGRYRYIELPNTKNMIAETITCLVKDLGLQKGEVNMCQGNILDKLAKKLIVLGFTVTRIKVEGELQDKLDESYKNSLRNGGIPERILDYLYDYHRFPGDIACWTAIDPENRLKLLSTIPPKRGYRLEYRNKGKTCRCFECDELIEKHEKRIVLTITNAHKPMCAHRVHPQCIKFRK